MLCYTVICVHPTSLHCLLRMIAGNKNHVTSGSKTAVFQPWVCR
jgi:hypothetical protein